MDSIEPSSYPARCHPPTHSAAALPAEGGAARLHGRLLEGERLLDGTGVAALAGVAGARAGDIVEARGRMRAGRLWVEELRVLAPALGAPWEGDWRRFNRNSQVRRHLELRAAVLREIRAFFAGRDFLEVETPLLVQAPGQEAHLRLFETQFSGREALNCFLVSSPELHMKRLLGGGCERIFQVCRCFRNGERSPLHNPEFTMLEWYRAFASYQEIMADTEELVAQVCQQVLGTTRLRHQGRWVELAPPWERLTVRQAFAEWAGIDLDACAELEEFRRQARVCPSVDRRDSREEIFFKVLLERIEPVLAEKGAVFLMDYPADLAALAKLKEGDGRVAERVEAYAGGLELANGFTELNDPHQQRQRFAAERRKRLEQGLPLHPLDEEFLQMLEQAMPPAGGMALGVDRLVMLVAGAAAIDEVIAFPFARVEEGL